MKLYFDRNNPEMNEDEYDDTTINIPEKFKRLNRIYRLKDKNNRDKLLKEKSF